MQQVNAAIARQMVLEVLADGQSRTLDWIHSAAQRAIQERNLGYITTPQVRYQLKRLYDQKRLGITPWARGRFKQYRYGLMKTEVEKDAGKNAP